MDARSFRSDGSSVSRRNIFSNEAHSKKDSTILTSLTSLDIWAIGISIVIGGQYYQWNTGLVAGFGSFAICVGLMAILYLCLCHCNAELSSSIPFAGGAYGLARLSLGLFPGFLIGCCEALEFIVYVADAAVSLSQLIVICTGTSSVMLPVYSAAFYISALAIHIWGGKLFWTVNMILAFISVFVIIVYILGALQFVDFNYYAPMTGSLGTDDLTVVAEAVASHGDAWFIGGLQEWLRVFPLAAWYYIGVESLNFCSMFVEEPTVIIPRGLLACIYTLVSTSIGVLFVCCSVYPGSGVLATSLAPLNYGFSAMFHMSSKWATMLSLPAAYATAFGFMFSYSRVIQAMARSGLFPEFLSRTFGPNNVPANALIVGSIIGYMFVLLICYFPELNTTIFNVCLLSAFSAYISQFIGFIRFRRNFSNQPRAFHNPLGLHQAGLGIALAAIGVISIVGFQGDVYHTAAIIFVCVLLLMIAYYFSYAKSRQSFSSEEQIIFRRQIALFNERARQRMLRGTDYSGGTDVPIHMAGRFIQLSGSVSQVLLRSFIGTSWLDPEAAGAGGGASGSAGVGSAGIGSAGVSARLGTELKEHLSSRIPLPRVMSSNGLAGRLWKKSPSNIRGSGESGSNVSSMVFARRNDPARAAPAPQPLVGGLIMLRNSAAGQSQENLLGPQYYGRNGGLSGSAGMDDSAHLDGSVDSTIQQNTFPPSWQRVLPDCGISGSGSGEVGIANNGRRIKNGAATSRRHSGAEITASRRLGGGHADDSLDGSGHGVSRIGCCLPLDGPSGPHEGARSGRSPHTLPHTLPPPHASPSSTGSRSLRGSVNLRIAPAPMVLMTVTAAATTPPKERQHHGFDEQAAADANDKNPQKLIDYDYDGYNTPRKGEHQQQEQQMQQGEIRAPALPLHSPSSSASAAASTNGSDIRKASSWDKRDLWTVRKSRRSIDSMKEAVDNKRIFPNSSSGEINVGGGVGGVVVVGAGSCSSPSQQQPTAMRSPRTTTNGDKKTSPSPSVAAGGSGGDDRGHLHQTKEESVRRNKEEDAEVIGDDPIDQLIEHLFSFSSSPRLQSKGQQESSPDTSNIPAIAIVAPPSPNNKHQQQQQHLQLHGLHQQQQQQLQQVHRHRGGGGGRGGGSVSSSDDGDVRVRHAPFTLFKFVPPQGVAATTGATATTDVAVVAAATTAAITAATAVVASTATAATTTATTATTAATAVVAAATTAAITTAAAVAVDSSRKISSPEGITTSTSAATRKTSQQPDRGENIVQGPHPSGLSSSV